MKGKYHNISGILASFCVAAGVGIATAVFLVVVSIFLPEEAVHFLDDYGDYITGIAFFTTFILVRQRFQERSSHKPADPASARKQKIRQHMSNIDRTG